MSWMQKLYETYESIGKMDLPTGEQATPLWHTPQNAHINIVINGAGEFRRAKVLDKGAQIVLPATEKSAGRTRRPEPHALADKLQYVAADYPEYGGRKPSHFGKYIEQLQKWCESGFAHEHVVAVHRFVKRGDVIRHLLDCAVVHADADGVLLTSWRGGDQPELFKLLPAGSGGKDQGNALVCWTVESAGEKAVDTWTNPEVHRSWREYVESCPAYHPRADAESGDADGERGEVNSGVKGLCGVTGEVGLLAISHPKKLRGSGDNAKLLSANDFAGFTFRGRFTDSDKSAEKSGPQSIGVAADVSQKAHSALRWLINRQGFRNGSQRIVAWAVSGEEIPDPTIDSWALLNSDSADEEASGDADPVDEAAAGPDLTRDVGEQFARSLENRMRGYKDKLALVADKSIVIMGLDSATPGRMAITYYRETLAHDFVDTVHRWHDDLAWFQSYIREVAGDDDEPKWQTVEFVGAPAVRIVVDTVGGESASDSLRRNLVQRILPCIVENRPIPWDIVQSAVHRASNRGGARKEQGRWERDLGVACALYKGYYRRHPDKSQRRKYQMALDPNNPSRDYLYGRLLAVAESIEALALRRADEKRPTNAERLMQSFAAKPHSTWRTIELDLQPYRMRLKSSRAGFLAKRDNELDEIHNAFVGDEFTSDAPLSGEFLLGYHCQRRALRKKKQPKGDAGDGTDNKQPK